MARAAARSRTLPTVLAAAAILATGLSWLVVAGTAAAEDAATAPGLQARIVSLGPWPPPLAPDPGNRVSGQPAAIAFGELLFHSPRLSTVGGLRCATCHEPWRYFADGRATGLGAAPGGRNTLSLLNARFARLYGWDGANDSLWAQSIRPMLDPQEMRSSAAQAAAAVRDNTDLSRGYVQAFGAGPGADDEAVLVDIAKALAAYQETLVSGRTPFDDWRDALARGDRAAATRYPAAAARGASLFAGKAACIGCHAGPLFSDGAFHRSLRPSLLPDGTPDTGRRSGWERWRASPYRRGGRFDDGPRPQPPADVDAESAQMQDHAFRTPGLRDVIATGPYMHDGSVDRLCDALQPHAADAGRSAAPPLSLDERRDLVAFLRTLSADGDPPLVEPSVWACR
jgi:cytochrome c peroxidase